MLVCFYSLRDQDIDLDGKSEVVSLPNSEKGFTPSCGSYITQHLDLFVLEGAYGNGGDPTADSPRSGLRKPGFDAEFPPHGGDIACKNCFDDTCTCRKETYYPPSSIPAIAFGDIQGDGGLEMVFSFSDGTISAYDNTGSHNWTFDFASYCGIDPQVHAIEGSEPTIADLNADGVAEVIFVTWGYPTDPPSSENNQHIFILSNNGTMLHDIPLNTASAGEGDTSFNGNGNGPCSAPTIGDLDGDGDLEIITNTFDGRMLIYSVPGSSTNCLQWPTGRGGYMRKGQPDVYYP